MSRRFAASRIGITESLPAFLLGVFLLASAEGSEKKAVAQDLLLSCGKDGELLSIGYPSDRAHGTRNSNGCPAGGACGNGERSAWDIFSAHFVQVFDDGMALAERLIEEDDPSNAKSEKASARRKVRKVQCTLPQCDKPGGRSQKTVAPAPAQMPQSDQIRLSYPEPLDGPNSAKNGHYDRKTLETAIRHSIAAGIDPYLALAVLLLENPPSEINKTFQEYVSRKGVLPVDQMAAFDQLGCLNTGAKSDHFPNLSDTEVKEYRSIHENFVAAESKYQKLVHGNPVLLQYHDAKEDLAARKELLADYQKKTVGAAKTAMGKAPAKAPVDPKLAKLKKDVSTAEQLVARLRQSGGEAAEKVFQTFVAARSAEQRFRTEIQKAKGSKGNLALEELSCAGEPKKCYMLIQKQKKIPRMDLSFLDAEEGRSGDNKRETLCTDATRVDVGKEPRFYKEGGNPDCCVDLTYPSDLKDGLAIQIKTRLGADYLRKQIQQCVASKEGSETLTYCLQKFQGLGGFGVTEASRNKCLAGMHMGDRPLYGARAADLMVNMLMANPEIRGMVEHVRQVTEQPVVSVFCLKSGKGPGTYLVQNHWFLNEQKEYLLRGAQSEHAERNSSHGLGSPDHRPFKMRVSSDSGARFRSPASRNELEKYLEMEKQRAQECRKVYWPDKKKTR